MNTYPVRSPAWYAEGLRWIGSVLTDAADYLDQPSANATPLEPGPGAGSVDEYLSDVRHRMQHRACERRVSTDERETAGAEIMRRFCAATSKPSPSRGGYGGWVCTRHPTQLNT